MRLDFVIAHLGSGGAQRVMVLLANHFCSLGYEVNIITFNKGLAFDLNKNINLVNLHDGKIPNHTLRSLWKLLTYYRKKDNRPSIMISFITQLSFVAIIAAKLYRIKIIASEHSNCLSAQKPIFLTNFVRNFLYPLADYLTVLTSYDVDYYLKKKINVTVMPNPLTFDIAPIKDSPKSKVVVAAGNLDRYHIKGFDNLLDIMTPLLLAKPDWKLKIVGGGEKGLSFLKAKAMENKILNSLILPGFRSDIAEIMQESEIFILSSRHEGLPMVLLEAMSQGMACISYDCITGPSDIITHNLDGFLVENQNIEEMKMQMAILMDDESIRKRFSQNAIRSLENFKIENISAKWENLFNNLIKE
ncbi:glycosyltransferase family 4 protein [Allomuricauda sp. R78024]|uniref:glycosyltransferase family 4 protein n=1 Tax=Allomuricauda sp. R78024 TaxID=3093867 RepID=UPI0037C554B9